MSSGTFPQDPQLLSWTTATASDHILCCPSCLFQGTLDTAARRTSEYINHTIPLLKTLRWPPVKGWSPLPSKVSEPYVGIWPLSLPARHLLCLLYCPSSTLTGLPAPLLLLSAWTLCSLILMGSELALCLFPPVASSVPYPTVRWARQTNFLL